jgi:hypothetical protein
VLPHGLPEDGKTGIRCYRRIGFRRHHLLRLASQARVNPVRNSGCRRQQPQGEVNGAGRNTPVGSPARQTEDAVATKDLSRRGKQIYGASLPWAETEN